MKWNEQTQQEAQQLVEVLTEKQWKTICEALPALVKPATPEQKQAEQERRERVQSSQKSMYEDLMWKQYEAQKQRKKIHEGVEIPYRYDFSIEEVSPLFDYAFHPAAGHDAIYETAQTLFVLGFRRGMSYQKNKGKKAKT